jgi:hypothetical protein
MMIRSGVVILLAALLLAAPAEARPDHPAAAVAAAKKKLTCKQAKRMHVRKLSRRERKRVLAKRRRCAKAQKRAAANRPGTAPSAPTAEPGTPGTGTSSPGVPAPDDPPGDYSAPLPDANPHALQVISGEFFLNLSKGQVAAGDVRVEFNNAYAEDPHDLHLVSPDGKTDYAFGELRSGEITARTVDLGKGSWSLFCSLPEHATRGMTATLKVE